MSNNIKNLEFCSTHNLIRSKTPRKNRGGFHYSCKECQKESSKKWKLNQTKESKNKVSDNRNKNRKKRRKNDPSFALREQMSRHMNIYFKKIGETKRNRSVNQFINYSFDELRAHIEKQFEPWMNWNNRGVFNKEIWDDNNPETWTWQLDHIIPQYYFNYNIEEDIKKCWSLNNLRPLSAKINLTEGHRRKLDIK